jgi:hypothetical protein
MLTRTVGAQDDAELRELEVESGEGVGRAFELRRGGGRDLLLVRSEGRGELKARVGPRRRRVESDFDWAWLRFSAETETLEEFVVVGGRRLLLDGVEVFAAGDGGAVEYQSGRAGESESPEAVALLETTYVRD